MKTHPGRQSKRLRNYDYRSYGAYFITICTRSRKCLFGEIQNNAASLSRIGSTVEERWLDIPNHHPFVDLDFHVVMPNHIHGIIWISIQALRVEMGNANQTSAAGFLKDSLSSVIASMKSAASRTANRISKQSAGSIWQRSFYDHVIRDESELQVIRQYIIDNPRQWELDRENPKRKGINPFYRWLDKKAQECETGR